MSIFKFLNQFEYPNAYCIEICSDLRRYFYIICFNFKPLRCICNPPYSYSYLNRLLNEILYPTLHSFYELL